MDNKSKNKSVTSKSKKAKLIPQDTDVNLRCINIDCVFNSSLKTEPARNFCNHPNVKIESKFADVTIAICSEFRSKKDFVFKKPSTLIELKTEREIEIQGQPEPITEESLNKITTQELETEIEKRREEGTAPLTPVQETSEFEGPKIIQSGQPETIMDLNEIYRLTDDPRSDFLILKRLYRPYLKKGIILSIILHLVLIWFLFAAVSEKEKPVDSQNKQRIVIVEDIERPKFEPPDMDKPKEEETPKDIGKNEVRPKITPRNIVPKIRRPKDKTSDTTEIVKKNLDSIKAVTDSLLALKKGDTTRLILPDSLKSIYSENEIGMSLWYPRGWKITDNRSVNLNQEQFNGVIINTDTLSEDPGAVQIFILIDNPKMSGYNKSTFKNPFQMEDSLYSAYSTDPSLTGNKKISYKFFIFTDPTSSKNIFVNSETKKDSFEKYKKYIESIVRSIKIVSKPSNP